MKTTKKIVSLAMLAAFGINMHLFGMENSQNNQNNQNNQKNNNMGKNNEIEFEIPLIKAALNGDKISIVERMIKEGADCCYVTKDTRIKEN